MKKRDIIITIIISVLIVIVMIFLDFRKEEYIIIDKKGNTTQENENIIEEKSISQDTDNKEEIKIENTKTLNDTNKKVVVYISGQVKNSGVVEMQNGDRLVDVIEKCGGMLDHADENAVNLALLLKDEEHYVIPKKGEVINNTNKSQSNSNQTNSLININTADENELEKIPTVGEKTAQKIINHRNTNGNFKSIEDIKNVTGIGDKKFEQMKDFITVN